MFQIAQGLSYLHSKKVVHGDLHGVNAPIFIVILFVDKYVIQFVRITFSSMMKGMLAWQTSVYPAPLTWQEVPTTHTSRLGGTFRWMAPELHEPKDFGYKTLHRTEASDMYTLGCVFLEVSQCQCHVCLVAAQCFSRFLWVPTHSWR
jgi:serine/threonine protein kinase